MANTMKHLQRFSQPLQLKDPDSQQEWPPKDDQFAQLHFRISDKPGYIEVFYNGKWYETAGITLINGLFTICPVGENPSPLRPPPPLRPV